MACYQFLFLFLLWYTINHLYACSDSYISIQNIVKDQEGSASYNSVSFTVFGCICIWAALKFHNDKAIDSFYSLRPTLGLPFLVVFGIQEIKWSLSHFFGTLYCFLILPVYSFCWWSLNLITYSILVAYFFLLPWHIISGLYISILAIIAATIGLLGKAIFRQSSDIISNYSN